MSNQLFVALLSIAILGCSPTLQDGRFTCATNADCPTDFSCRAGLCYRGESDAGPENDAPPMDAPPSDGGDVDTGTTGDAGPPCGRSAASCGPRA